MQWRQIRYALEVGKNGSFTRAAERVHISQSALSEQVKLLEDRLGFPLFVRTGRGVEVTEKGRTFLHEAGRIANDMVHLHDVARHLLAADKESIKVGMISGLAHVLMRRVFPLGEILRNRQLEVRTAPTRVIFDELFHGRLDVGFAITVDPEFVPVGLSVERLFEIDLVLITPPGHPIAQTAGACDIRKLADEPIIMSELSVGYGLMIMNMFGSLGLHPRIQAVVDNIETMAALVAAGVGVAIVPSGAAESEEKLGLVKIMPIEPSGRINVEVYRPRGAMPKHKEAFYEQIVAKRDRAA